MSEEKNFGHLGPMFQLSLLKTIIDDKKFATSIIDVMDPKYFDGQYFRYLMQNIKELHTKFNKIPDYVTLQYKIMNENVNTDTAYSIHMDTLENINNHIVPDSEYIKEVSLNFCRQQVLKKAIKDVEDIMSQGKFEEYHKVEEIIRTALQVGVNTDEVIDVVSNVREALENDDRVPFPLGIEGLDSLLKGGLARGELGVILAPLGVGKTTMMTKMANSAFNTGANVLQVFFEDSLKTIRKKHYTIWTGISPDDLKLNIEEVESIVGEKEKAKNGLKLLKLPSYGTTISDIKTRIRKLKSEGFVVDLLLIDYVDCITSEKNIIGGEEWKGEAAIMRQLESMTTEFNMAIWVATQGDRSSISSELVNTDQMGGSIKKAQIGHVIISIGKTLEQKEHKLATMVLLKSRIGDDGIVFQNCGFNNEYLDINTETQNTLLGHEEDKEKRKQERIQEVYRKRLEDDELRKSRQENKLEKNN